MRYFIAIAHEDSNCKGTILARAVMGQDIRVVAQAIAQNWPLIEGDISHEYEEIALADYAVLSKVLEDKTPPF